MGTIDVGVWEVDGAVVGTIDVGVWEVDGETETNSGSTAGKHKHSVTTLQCKELSSNGEWLSVTLQQTNIIRLTLYFQDV